MRNTYVPCAIDLSVVSLEVFVYVDVHVAVRAMQHGEQTLVDIDQVAIVTFVYGKYSGGFEEFAHVFIDIQVFRTQLVDIYSFREGAADTAFFQPYNEHRYRDTEQDQRKHYQRTVHQRRISRQIRADRTQYRDVRHVNSQQVIRGNIDGIDFRIIQIVNVIHGFAVNADVLALVYLSDDYVFAFVVIVKGYNVVFFHFIESDDFQNDLGAFFHV